MLSQRTKALLSIIHHTVDTLPTLFSSVRILCNAARSLFLFLVYCSRSTWFARCRAGIRTEHLQMGTKHPCLFLFIALWGRMWMWMWMSRTNRVVRGNVDLAAACNAMRCNATQRPSGRVRQIIEVDTWAYYLCVAWKNGSSNLLGTEPYLGWWALQLWRPPFTSSNFARSVDSSADSISIFRLEAFKKKSSHLCTDNQRLTLARTMQFAIHLPSVQG